MFHGCPPAGCTGVSGILVLVSGIVASPIFLLPILFTFWSIPLVGYSDEINAQLVLFLLCAYIIHTAATLFFSFSCSLVLFSLHTETKWIKRHV
ncbi:hypothetical protein L228DRAFT_120227 [Xylona heveae TC161]|uniref:Uncharacterized protein n=1 Tax=Xylona heveae (strain CBS 132557 / TC161) TaxID=1328760 RepID=A0A165HIZ8_XYLHT|nr:hypothetical protein L228DRAFT_120227 [Xylona heveae TC161]KZF23590.1 hypothetical protein L228DRAFT_120227 [Xylona heveae TC161]